MTLYKPKSDHVTPLLKTLQWLSSHLAQAKSLGSYKGFMKTWASPATLSRDCVPPDTLTTFLPSDC